MVATTSRVNNLQDFGNKNGLSGDVKNCMSLSQDKDSDLSTVQLHIIL